MVPSSLGCGAVVFAASAMFQPSRARRRAMALPMPRLPPVIKAVRFFRVCCSAIRFCKSKDFVSWTAAHNFFKCPYQFADVHIFQYANDVYAQLELIDTFAYSQIASLVSLFQKPI